MEFLSGQIDFSVVSDLLLPLLIGAALVAVALVSGLAARIAMFIEELPHRNAAKAQFAPAGPDAEPTPTGGGSR